MHDLIQDMGHEIVRLQCEDDPGKRSRLWKADDVNNVLSKNKVYISLSITYRNGTTFFLFYL